MDDLYHACIETIAENYVAGFRKEFYMLEETKGRERAQELIQDIIRFSAKPMGFTDEQLYQYIGLI